MRALIVGRWSASRNARSLVVWWNEGVIVLLKAFRVRTRVEGDWDNVARAAIFVASVSLLWKMAMILSFFASS